MEKVLRGVDNYFQKKIWTLSTPFIISIIFNLIKKYIKIINNILFTTPSGKNEKLGAWFSCDERVSKDSINYVMVRIKIGSILGGLFRVQGLVW